MHQWRRYNRVRIPSFSILWNTLSRERIEAFSGEELIIDKPEQPPIIDPVVRWGYEAARAAHAAAVLHDHPPERPHPLHQDHADPPLQVVPDTAVRWVHEAARAALAASDLHDHPPERPT